MYVHTFLFIYFLQSADQLVLLNDGKLRHYTNSNEEEDELYEHRDYDADLDDERKSRFHDYAAGQYCIDRVSTYGSVVKITNTQRHCRHYENLKC